MVRIFGNEEVSKQELVFDNNIIIFNTIIWHTRYCLDVDTRDSTRVTGAETAKNVRIHRGEDRFCILRYVAYYTINHRNKKLPADKDDRHFSGTSVSWRFQWLSGNNNTSRLYKLLSQELYCHKCSQTIKLQTVNHSSEIMEKSILINKFLCRTLISTNNTNISSTYCLHPVFDH